MHPSTPVICSRDCYPILSEITKPEAILAISVVAFFAIGMIATLGAFPSINVSFSYGMYAGAGFLFIVGVIRGSTQCCKKPAVFMPEQGVSVKEDVETVEIFTKKQIFSLKRSIKHVDATSADVFIDDPDLNRSQLKNIHSRLLAAVNHPEFRRHPEAFVQNLNNRLYNSSDPQDALFLEYFRLPEVTAIITAASHRGSDPDTLTVISESPLENSSNESPTN